MFYWRMAESRHIMIPRFRGRIKLIQGVVCPCRVLVPFVLCLLVANVNATETTNAPSVAVLLVDTDRVMGNVDRKIYGQFLEHINHSVEGLFAEQIQGRGFEGEDFQTHWSSFATNGNVSVVNVPFQNGEKSLRLQADNGSAGVRQDGIYLQQGYDYNGSVFNRRQSSMNSSVPKL